MNYVVIAHDHTDEKALERRLATREAHLAAMEPYKKQGKVIFFAATKNDQGNMNGSIVFWEVESKEEIVEYLTSEPYLLENVWENYDIIEVALPVK